MDVNDHLFKDKSFSDLMSDVYHNSKKKDRQINQLISQLQPLIRTASDATIIVPLIKDYLEVSVKNDDHLAKLLAVVQRLIGNNSQGESDFGISEEEKAQLLEELNAIEKNNANIDDKIKGVENGRILKSKE